MYISLNDRKVPLPIGVSPDKRTISPRTSMFAIQFFHYKKQYLGGPTWSANVSKDYTTENFILHDELTNVTISKTLGSKGSCSVTLAPSANWKAKISTGDWFIIYAFNEFSKIEETFKRRDEYIKNIVFVGNVDRVSRQIFKDEETDKVELRYQMVGSNFGKVFEKTDIWFNPFTKQEASNDIALIKAGLQMTGTPDELVKQTLNIFLGPGKKSIKDMGDIRDLNNWKMPSAMANLWARGSTFYQILDQQIESGLPGFAPRQLLTLDSNGSLMNLLQRYSNPLVNELFYDECRDVNGGVRPRIILRPRPLNTMFLKEHFVGNGGALAALKGKYKSLYQHSQVDCIEISELEIKYEDLGQDDHSRFNMIWLTAQQGYEAYMSTMAPNLGVNGARLGLPTFNEESINRYGLTRLEQVLEFCYPIETGTAGVVPDIDLYKAFIGQLYDFHYCNHFYESGTVECTGVVEAQLGQALKIIHAHGQDKIYYIEGYTHNYQFPGTWTTNFTLTHGQWYSPTKPFIDFRPEDRGMIDDYFKDFYYGKSFVKQKNLY